MLALALAAPLAVSRPEAEGSAVGAGAPLPERLSDTGLFAPGTTRVRAGVAPFSPQYPLWSDGATKRRWIYLPPGSSIDARNPDAWEFPVGTRLWKEFSYGDRAIETRYIERIADGSWRFATYVWNEAGTDAVLAPADGVPAARAPSAPSGRYAVPSEADCRACHEGAPVPVLGFSALQLSPDRDPLAPHAERPGPDTLDLRKLVARGWLENLPTALRENAPRIAADSPAERAALGYLHGNCGHCHSGPSEAGAAVPVPLMLAQRISDPRSAERVKRSLIGATSRYRPAGQDRPAQLVAPGRSHESVLAFRMRSRDALAQMPPLGTEAADADALVLISRWIDHDLKPNSNPGSKPDLKANLRLARETSP